MGELDRREIKAIVQEAVKQATPEAVKSTLELFGVDVSQPRETQADMIYLRQLRKGAGRIGEHITRSAIWAGVCGISYILYIGIKSWLSGLSNSP